jgi:hypothetical protein
MGLPYGMQKWRPQGVIRRGRFASHCGPDLAYGHPDALRTIHMRNGFALRYAKIGTARDHPLRSPSFALRCTPGIRTSWCPAQHLNPQWACYAVRYAKKEAARGHPPRSHRFADLACGHPGALHSSHISAVASLRTAAQTWGADILVPCVASTFAMRLPEWRPQGIIRRGRLAAHCGTDLAYGHRGALRSIHIRSGFAIRYPNMAPQTDRLPRSPRCTLRQRPGIRISWCASQHRHPRWVCHTGFKHGARKGSSAAVASLRTAAQTWHTDFLVPCTASKSPMGSPCCTVCQDGAARGHPPRSHRFALRRRPGVRTSWCAAQQPHLRGRLASHCGPDRHGVRTSWCSASHPHSQCICQNGARKVSSAAVASLRTAAQMCTDILVLCAASTSAVGWPYVIRTWGPKRITRRNRLASHCGTDLAYGHPGAPHSIGIRDGFAIRYSNMAPARGHAPRSLRCALRPRPGVRTSGCPAHHPHSQWVCPTVCQAGDREGSSAAVASLRSAILVPCTASKDSKSAMGLPCCTVC